MKRIVIALLALLAAPTVAFAQQSVNVDGLNAQQVAEIQAQIEAKKTETPEGQVRASIERANEWVDIGEGIGAGVAAAARETGQVVNEFAVTPVGKMTTFVILWKVIGKDLLGVIVGSIVMVAFTTIWLVYTNRLFSKEKTVTINADKSRVVSYRDRVWSEGDGFTAFMAVVIFLVVNTLLLSFVIF